MKVSNSQQRIKELLNFYCMSQAEFCKRTGIATSALSNYLKGIREPRQDKISAIADAFDIDPAWLMGYDVPMKKKYDQNDRIFAYFRYLSELTEADRELIFNQIDYLWERKNENSKQ